MATRRHADASEPGSRTRDLEGEVGQRAALEFQRREWRVDVFGWAAMALLLGAGLLGVFGGGPLAGAEATATDGSIAVHYPRFMRNNVSEEMRIEVRARAGGDRVPIAIERAWTEAVQIERVTPLPAEVRSDDEWVTYVFEAAEGRAAVIVDFQARGPGRLGGRMRVDGEPVRVRALVYP
jgi:hypothetical protein